MSVNLCVTIIEEVPNRKGFSRDGLGALFLISFKKKSVGVLFMLLAPNGITDIYQ